MANDEEQVNDQVNYENVFNAEIEGWCYGLYHYPGEITAPLVHALIREIRATFVRAVENNVVFNVTEISELFCQAAKYLIPEKEIAFSILVQLPSPQGLNEGQLYTLAQVLDTADKAYGGVLERLQSRWKHTKAAA